MNEVKHSEPDNAAANLDEMLVAIKNIRKSDCGAWLKDCQSGMFSCVDGREKRCELSRLLDRLYESAGI